MNKQKSKNTWPVFNIIIVIKTSKEKNYHNLDIIKEEVRIKCNKPSWLGCCNKNVY